MRKDVIFIALIIVVLLILFIHFGKDTEVPFIEFCGGAREVGGSCLLFETRDSRFVVDCGAMSEAKLGILPPEPEKLNFAILTHAHSDHCGYFPHLCERGFKGKIYCTRPTAEIVPVMLEMARSFERDKVSREGFDWALQSLVPVDFNELISEDNVSFRFRRAEHVLGAGFVEIWIDDEMGTIKVVVSGDLGSGNSILLPTLEKNARASCVIMESTYGATSQNYGTESAFERKKYFAARVGATLRNGGDVLIPAFSLGRTQEVVATIDFFKKIEIIPPRTHVFTDSPTAKKISEIYRKFPGELSPWARDFYSDHILSSSGLREVRSKICMAVHSRRHRATIFISSSGNLSYANSPRHLMKMYGSEKNLVCLVGWQSPGSPGWHLERGDSTVLIKYHKNGQFAREWISPSLQIESFFCFSSHADREGLVQWLEGMEGIEKLYLVHGEEEESLEMAEYIDRNFSIEVEVPRRGDRVGLAQFAVERNVNR